ncbi:MAG: hypothetical protein LBJ14_07110 [Desulfarculales bacterium]|jgi:hypothetical protein|nr:hypothetical protein [Desulfarculales bacterium]
MKKIVIVVILIVGIAFLCFANYWQQKEVNDIDEAIFHSKLDHGRLKNEIIPRLNRAIKARNDNPRLIKLRLEMFVTLGLLQNAKIDNDKMIDLTNSNDYRYFSCLLAESMGEGRKDEYLQCYRDVYALYSAEEKDINDCRVFAALMGEVPEAENIRDLYLESITNQELRRWCTDALVPFKREAFLLPYTKDDDAGKAVPISGLK